MEGRSEVLGRMMTPHGDIGAPDTFVGNMHRGTGGDGTKTLGSRASKGVIADIKKHGY